MYVCMYYVTGGLNNGANPVCSDAIASEHCLDLLAESLVNQGVHKRVDRGIE